MTLEALKEAIVADLSTELNKDPDFREDMLSSKVEQAIREIQDIRKYPPYYTDEMIEADMSRYRSNVYKIALSDYNQIGVDFQTAHNENGVSRTYSDRSKLFYGIIPIAVL